MKKILSLILALSLIISVAPMSFATDAEETIDEPGMYFNFGAAGYGSETGDIGYNILAEYDDYRGQSYDASWTKWAKTGLDQWRVDGVSYMYEDNRLYLTDEDGYTIDIDEDGTPDEIYHPNALSFKAKGSDTLNQENIYNGALGKVCVVIALKLNETGIFVPTLTYHVGPDLPKCHVYLTKRNKGELQGDNKYITFNTDYNGKNAYDQLLGDKLKDLPKEDGVYLGEIDMHAKEPGTKTIEFSSYEITDTSSTYVLCFRMSNVNEEVYSKYEKDLPDYVASIHSFKLTPLSTAKVDTNYSSENAPTTATVSRLALYGDTSAVIETEDVTYGESTDIPAVAKTYTDKAGDTYNFLYWAKGLENGVGNKHIISTGNEQFSYKPHEGANYLIAVYEKAGAEKAAAFYDRNGQLLNIEITDDKLPALPAMAGLGDAIGWEQLGTGTVFDENVAFSDIKGDKVFMAKYNELSENITIGINGVSDTYKYGDVVTCESNDEKFSYWEKTVNGKSQIVSLDKTYTFNAWENCTIKAVCNGTVSEEDLGRTARKILLSTFSVGENLTAVMAEFIGFGAAKEKGIMFDGRKIAMTTNKAQFTVTNDTADTVTVTGYAIVEENEKTVQYTDGSISVAGVTAATAE